MSCYVTVPRKYGLYRIQRFCGLGTLNSMHDMYFKKLCKDLRDSEGEEDIRRAADALRRYMQDQQFILRRRLAPSVEKAFMMMDADRHQSN